MLKFSTLICGVLFCFAFPHAAGKGFALFAPLSLIGFFYIQSQLVLLKQKYLYTLLFLVGINTVGFYWLPYTLQIFGELPVSFSYFVSFFFAFIIFPVFWFIPLWEKQKKWLYGSVQWSYSLELFLQAMWLTTLELLLPQQFNVQIGHIWIHYAEKLSLAPVFGAGVYSFFTWWICLTISFCLNSLLKKPKPKIDVSSFPYAALFWQFLFTLTFFISIPFKSSEVKNPLETSPLNIRIVQGNVGNFMKIAAESGDPLLTQDVISLYRDLSLSQEPEKIDLIIWPETAYPYSFHTQEMKGNSASTPDVFLQVIGRTGSQLLIGAYDHDEKKSDADYFESEFNAAILFNRQGSLNQVYHKHKLIPFGETMPFGPLNRTLSEILPQVSFFARGKDTPLFKLDNQLHFVTPICYEALDSRFMAKLIKGAKEPVHFLVNLTNDSWYGKTAEPEQHLFLAKWRALEFQLPIIRSTNTGISTVIFPNGQTSPRLEMGVKGVLDLQIPIATQAPQTIYLVWGYVPLALLWLIIGVSLSFFWMRKIQREIDRES
jgi:apolipoprotein N-acyltransferase